MWKRLSKHLGMKIWEMFLFAALCIVIAWLHLEPVSEVPSPVVDVLSNQRHLSETTELHYLLGGLGPWVPRIEGIVERNMTPPASCEVVQVHMMARHAERFPTNRRGPRMVQLLRRLQNPDVTLKGDLAFVKHWTFISAEPQTDYEQLTTTGAYAGTLTAFSTGVNLRSRYRTLIPLTGPRKIRFWASGGVRVVDTARLFALGFFGLDWQNSASLVVVPETPDRGGDTLTPGRTCRLHRSDIVHGHAQGDAKSTEFGSTYLPAIASRLEGFISIDSPDREFHLSIDEVRAMQELCGFEIMVRGTSPWCGLFAKEEWENFEYARDVYHYYKSGPGTKLSMAMGSLWLSATADLLQSGPDIGRLFFTFVHDGDLGPMLTALNIINPKNHLSVTARVNDRDWKTSQVTPMMGRVIFELLECGKSDGESLGTRFVRVNINDGIVAIPDCQSGPGSSCPLEQFLRRTREHAEAAGDFRTVCQLEDDLPSQITFLHQREE